ncbi:MAG: glycosyltransferase [Microgenomates group bacterium]
MNKEPFFSIVIPCLNEEKSLPLLLQDLVNQTLQDFEVIVVDGNSKDKTVENANKFKKLLPSLSILHSKIRNVSVQRNMGGEAGKGTYLLFNDADNRLPKHFLEGVKYHIGVKPTDMFTTWCLPDSNRRSDKAIATNLNLLTETGLLLGTPGALGAMIGCRRKIFGKIGGFNPEVAFAEDSEFIRHGYRKGYTFSIIREPRYVYSLRRFRKIGTLKLLQKYAVLNLKIMTNQEVDQKKEYPMGGEYLEKDDKTTAYFKNLQSVFIKKNPKKSILEKIRALLSLEESDL